MSRSRNTRKRRKQNKVMLIALEDTKSSRYYFQALAKHKNNAAKIFFVDHIGTTPVSVLKAIRNYESKNLDVKYEKAWIVIDRDSFEKENFKCTIEECRANNICVAFSNECYELWILLHFKNITSYKSRHDIKKDLNKIFKDKFGCEYKKSEQNIYQMINEYQDDAIKRAESLIKRLLKEKDYIEPYDDNPATTIHFLVQCLNNLDECKKNEYECPKLKKD